MAKGIVSLLRDENLGLELAQNAYRKFVQEYDPHRLALREVSMIEDFCRTLNIPKE